VWVNFGHFSGRGLYSDDFVFAWLSETHPYVEALQHWREAFPAGGRLVLAAITPLVYGLFCGSNPLDNNLAGFHAFLVIIHFLNTLLLWSLLRRYKMGPLASGVGALIFLLHPAKNPAVFWPAAAYGYGIPLLFFLVGWHCQHEHGSRSAIVLLAGYSLWLAAALSIEQFIVVELALLAFWVIRTLAYARAKGSALWPIGAALVLSSVFLYVHFGLGETTTKRLQHYAQRHEQTSSAPSKEISTEYLLNTGFVLAWRLNPFPFHSPYRAAWAKGSEQVREGHFTRVIAVGALLIAVGFLVAQELWQAPPHADNGDSMAVACHGTLLAGAALAPFVILGMGAGPERGTLVMLVGLGMACAGCVQWLLPLPPPPKWKSFEMARVVAICVVILAFGLSATIIAVGQNKYFREIWSIEKKVFNKLREAGIRGGDLVIVEGLPQDPNLSQLFEDSWGFLYALRWMTGDEHVDGWTSRMRSPRPIPMPGQRVVITRAD
jgi:hypothetical protein